MGRAGQWVLHQEQDIYRLDMDTRPQTRRPQEDVPVRNLVQVAREINDYGLMWSGQKAPPNLSLVPFWEAKLQHFKALAKQVEEKCVQPGFTLEELRVLESMEQRQDNVFGRLARQRKESIRQEQNIILAVLMHLPKLGRPGHWILHNEDLYHAELDTRPKSRKPGKPIAISCLSQGLKSVGFTLFWDGTGPPPDFDDLDYWTAKDKELWAKADQAEAGNVHPDFTPQEVQALEALERDESHYFARCEKIPIGVVAPVLSPTAKAAIERMKSARLLVWDQLHALWQLGLPGRWILHGEDIYLPELDTRRRDQGRIPDDDDNDGKRGEDNNTHSASVSSTEARARALAPSFRITAIEGLVGHRGDFGLRYDGAWPPPDFNDVAYWEAKLAHLQEKRKAVEAGQVEHNFTARDLMNIELVERDSQRETDAEKAAAGLARHIEGVEAWLDGRRDGDDVEERERMPSLQPQSKRARDEDEDSGKGQTKRAKTQSNERQQTWRLRDSEGIGQHQKNEEEAHGKLARRTCAHLA
ncbi:hypothetical protein SPI_01442 [Niveomyces insectorum RCEF 264]|uniref:Uncharacterized protein n=1 Tax=Niveomyces insectorum RCEF 264 TaxID=1081102 RepID=A0A167YYZ3_9HYPO|nr:hypothetical protein SPI_01442 [Niveomyces insectorum RCEF 264]